MSSLILWILRAIGFAVLGLFLLFLILIVFSMCFALFGDSPSRDNEQIFRNLEHQHYQYDEGATSYRASQQVLHNQSKRYRKKVSQRWREDGCRDNKAPSYGTMKPSGRRYPPLQNLPLGEDSGSESGSDIFYQTFPDQEEDCIGSNIQAPYRSFPLRNTDEIRLLIISPAPFHAPLRGQLVTHDLDYSRVLGRQYDALSYTWGDESGDATKSVTLELEDGAGTIFITKNCAAAIRHLRQPNHSRRVWIDAVCIDQENYGERNHQVSMMARVYISAENVIAYTGEGTTQTDKLFDWLDGPNGADIEVHFNRGAQFAKSVQRYWEAGLEAITRALRKEVQEDAAAAAGSRMSESELGSIVANYFSRRWFRRVWVLQEVCLREPGSTTIICGTKSISAARALGLLSLLKKHPAMDLARIFILAYRPATGYKISHLLDILVETSSREAEDPRDKIFGVLNIAKLLDYGNFPSLEADYSETTQQVYTRYSRFFIEHHGPGFFLALIKSRPKLQGLPSWAADWTVAWPNRKSLEGKNLAATTRSRNAEVKQKQLFSTLEDGRQVLLLSRPRILRGYFTRTGHLDGSIDARLEDVGVLGDKQVLVEIYPGLAVLLAKTDYGYEFVQTCPHALSAAGVEALVGRWSNVVVGEMELNEFGKSGNEYLGAVELFSIC
ncbi:HET-domain-containing protein [Thozetella sp. PMI_491]|nr:HET-domain-containing protein [Thozetella sp. PMI_491]